MQALFDQKKLAVVANVGMLVQPSTKPGLETGGAPRPANLFSHSDQELAVQSGVYTGFERVGWGGRVADRLDAANPGTLFPPMASVMGLRTFVSGRTSVPLTVPSNPFFQLVQQRQRATTSTTCCATRRCARCWRRTTRATSTTPSAQLYAQEGMSASSVVAPVLQNKNSVVAPFFASIDTDVSRQLKTIAMLIEGRGMTQMRRQVFYAHQWGYDTHGSQPTVQAKLLGEVAQALKAFQDVRSRHWVSAGTSRCSRCRSSAARSSRRATRAPTTAGATMPSCWVARYAAATSTARFRRPRSMAPTISASNGRWIPTTSIEQYGATLCRWFGIAEGDLPYVFPNIGAFPNTNLGFMA